jgi:hypothetical protein
MADGQARFRLMRDDREGSMENTVSDDDFLSKMTAADAPTDDPETPEPETDAPEVVEKGEPETPAEVAPEAPPAPEKPKEADAVPLAALKAERAKRQQLERELETLRTAQQQAPAQQPSDFFEDPMGVLQATVSKVEQQAQQRLYAVLDAEARETYADYDEVMDLVRDKVAENPAIRDQIFNSPNPAKAAYRLGKQFAELTAMQDPQAYRARIEAEIRAQITAEQTAKQAAKASAAAAIPPDLAANRSTNTGQPVDTPDPFANLFKRQ